MNPEMKFLVCMLFIWIVGNLFRFGKFLMKPLPTEKHDPKDDEPCFYARY